MKIKISFIFGLIALIAIILLYYSEQDKIDSTLPTSWTEDHAADCGVVLTGGPYRINEGFALLNQRQIQKLILSGVNSKVKLIDLVPMWPFYKNLEESDIVLEKTSQTTYGNAIQSLQLVQAIGCRDIVLITSRVHMYRSYNTFKKVFPEGYNISQRAIVAQRLAPGSVPLFFETVKSLFYSIWAY